MEHQDYKNKINASRKWVEQTATFDKMSDGMLKIFEKVIKK